MDSSKLDNQWKQLEIPGLFEQLSNSSNKSKEDDENEVGTLHKSRHNIQKLINCFENQPDLSPHFPGSQRPTA